MHETTDDSKAKKTHIIVPGPRMRIEWAVAEDGSMPARDFFYSELSPKTQAKFMASFRRMATTGTIGQKRKFHDNEADGLAAFKADTPEGRMVRLPCFRISNRWIIATGFFKPAQSAWPAWAISDAKRVRDSHEARESKQKKPVEKKS